MTRQLPESQPQRAGGPAGPGPASPGPAGPGPASSAVADAGWPPEGEGQLPFSLRIGVTGHRQLTDPAALVPAVQAAIGGVIERFLGPGAEPALLVISALAEGADRLVATEVLAGPDATLEAVLPLPPGDYLADFTGDASKAEFTELLGRAASVWVARPGDRRDEAYERAWPPRGGPGRRAHRAVGRRAAPGPRRHRHGRGLRPRAGRAGGVGVHDGPGHPGLLV